MQSLNAVNLKLEIPINGGKKIVLPKGNGDSCACECNGTLSEELIFLIMSRGCVVPAAAAALRALPPNTYFSNDTNFIFRFGIFDTN
jgi:hypothetical protein